MIDIRKGVADFETIACVPNNVIHFYSRTDVLFSPDDQLIVTGISLDRGDTEGKLVFLHRNNLQKASELVVSKSVSNSTY